MRFSAIFILGLVFVKQFDSAECYEDEEPGGVDLALTGEVAHAKNDDAEKALIISERRAKPRVEKGDKKQRKQRRKEKSPMRPAGLTVVQVPSGDIVTNASFGDNVTMHVRSYVGNWTEHAQCLMPCNPRHDNPCRELANGNCSCVARNDKWGRDVGVCALKNVSLGSYEEYGRTTAWMPLP
ncbi:uncharacterized protein LOC144118641 [Amblyomma americanum]